MWTTVLYFYTLYSWFSEQEKPSQRLSRINTFPQCRYLGRVVQPYKTSGEAVSNRLVALQVAETAVRDHTSIWHGRCHL